MVAPTRSEHPGPARAEPEGGACPRCGAPFEPLQEYCLDCGLRLPMPPSGVVAALGGAWRRRLRWYPGDWIWTALALLAIAALGAAVAILASREEPAPRTIVATTGPGVTTRRAVRTTPSPTAEPGAQARRPATPSPPAGPPARRPQPQRALIEWPANESGWTVVLRSDPSAATARSEARRAIRSGLRDVGVLDSSDYSSLHPDYYVVFAGIYESQRAAEDALSAAASAGYTGAYVRPVSP